MPYLRGSHTAFHHRYHIVWASKYRFKVLHGEVRLRVREIIRQVCSELGGTIKCPHFGTDIHSSNVGSWAHFGPTAIGPIADCPHLHCNTDKGGVAARALKNSSYPRFSGDNQN